MLQYISMIQSSRVVQPSSSRPWELPWLAVVQTSTLSDGHNLAGSAPPIAQRLHPLHHSAVALNHLAENHMLVVQVRGKGDSDEELAVICVPPRVGHREQAHLVVFHNEVLIIELGAVDGLAAPAVPAGDVAALKHELGDDPMEGGLGVAKTLLPGAECPEVLRCPGNNVIIELKLNPAGVLAVDIDVKKHYWPGSRG